MKDETKWSRTDGIALRLADFVRRCKSGLTLCEGTRFECVIFLSRYLYLQGPVSWDANKGEEKSL